MNQIKVHHKKKKKKRYKFKFIHEYFFCIQKNNDEIFYVFIYYECLLRMK